jgi:hypothetical protein
MTKVELNADSSDPDAKHFFSQKKKFTFSETTTISPKLTSLAKIKITFFCRQNYSLVFTRQEHLMLNNNCVSWVTTTSPEGHLDLDEGLVAVGQQVLGLPRVDTHHPQQQVTARTQRHLHLQKCIN